ncbi:MAG: hypothetical protein Q4E36_04945 [Bacillota bacterium]|nr:hypothetical protein [Bacillota bacterium]
MEKLFVFEKVPENLQELKGLAEASLDSPYKTAALSLLALYNFDKDKEAAFEMLEFLKGPGGLNTMEKQFLQDRLRGKQYKIRSFFQGAKPENNYQPSLPLRLSVGDNANSFTNENWANLYVSSGGADSPRPIQLREKPSTGQWFLVELHCLSDIRLPVDEDPWA